MSLKHAKEEVVLTCLTNLSVALTTANEQFFIKAKETELARVVERRASDAAYASTIIPNEPDEETLESVNSKLKRELEWSFLWPVAGKEGQKIDDVGVEDVSAMIKEDALPPADKLGKDYSKNQLKSSREELYSKVRELLENADMIWPDSSKAEALQAVKLVLGR